MILNIFVIFLLAKMDKINSDASFPKSPSIYSNNFNPHQQVAFNDHHHSYNFNSMKSHIKEILNISKENQTIDEYIENNFPIDNPNPTYIFVLPDENNRSLIFRRTDFNEMNFPKIPTTNKFENKTLSISSTSKVLEMESTIFEQITPEKLTQNQFDDFVFDNLKNDDKYDSIIMQNIRTERNFISMVNNINDHPESFTKNPITKNNSKIKPIAANMRNVRSKNNYKVRSRTYDTVTIPPNDFYIESISKHTTNRDAYDKDYDNIDYNNDWDALGLEGWSGAIREPKNKFKYVAERPPNTEIFISNIDIDKPENYSSQINLKNPNKTPKINKQRLERDRQSKSDLSSNESFETKNNHQNIKISNKYQPKHSSTFHNADGDSGINRYDISEQLSTILANERKEIKRKYEKNGEKGSVVPKFLITTTRDQHLSEYVLIARANNPFGHSTKWKFNNDSSKTNATIKQMVKDREGRIKRGVVELYSMIKCGTGCDPLIYKGYGCYCGFLGSGKALDGIDSCCAMHDYCYSESSCPMFLEYFVPYLWKCYKGRPLCAIDHGEWGGSGSCAARLCECDRVLARCLRQYYCPHTRAECSSSPWRVFQSFILDFGS